MSGAMRRKTFYVVHSCPSTFFSSTSTMNRFGERFRGGQHSLVSSLFSVLEVLLTMPAVSIHS